MKPLDARLVSRLDLHGAVQSEAQAVRSWLPPEPAWGRLFVRVEEVASALRTRLASGYIPRRELISNMRKSTLAIRPLSIWWPLDRFVYRALTAFILRNETQPDQSGTAYTTFVDDPVQFTFSPGGAGSGP